MGGWEQFNANVLKNIVPRGAEVEGSGGGSSRVLERSWPPPTQLPHPNSAWGAHPLQSLCPGMIYNDS